MKTEYKYIRFTHNTETPPGWDCNNIHHGEMLGEVIYFSEWRQWVYRPLRDAVYSVGCLNDIADFIKQMKGEAK